MKKIKWIILSLIIIAILTISIFILSENDISKLIYVIDDDTANDIIECYLERFIYDIRTVPDNLFDLKVNIADAYIIFSPEYHEELTDLLDINNPFTIQENNITVEVSFTFFEKITETAWRVQWDETYYIDNQLQEPVTMVGYFTYYQVLPESEDQYNPLGIYFSEIYIYQPAGINLPG